MKVILLKDIKGVGKELEEKNVSDGYAANFLIPKNLALRADKIGLAKAAQLTEHQKSKKEREALKIEEKEEKREEKRLELEKFKQEQRSQSSS